MTKRDALFIKIENYTLRLNNLAHERKLLFDRLWTLEQGAEEERTELLRLLTEWRKLREREED